MELWLQGFQIALSGMNVLYLILGMLVGLVIGALPGLGPLFGVALMLPLTYGMPPATAIIFLVSVHAATAYGDSIASILINTPGSVATVAACWDGYPMARQGKAGVALGISTTSSMIGGIMGWLSMVLISPFLVAIALKMGPPEYFMLALMALSLLAMAGRGETIKGVMMGGLGLLLYVIGQDPIGGNARFALDFIYLEDGLPLVPVVVGLFALSQAFVMMESGESVNDVQKTTGGMIAGFLETVRRPWTIVRGGVAGILLGIMPALGLSAANVMAYMVEKKASKEPETFGHGNPAGLIAPETAKSACVVGDLIPTFTLGIPGSSTTALLMAAMIMHGLQPGPRFFAAGSLPYAVFAGVLLAQIAFFFGGLALVKYFAMIIKVPNSIMAPTIVVLSFLGAYAMKNKVEDVVVVIIFGVIGYVLQKCKYESAALVLGFILGDLVESNFHRALIMGRGSYDIFFTRAGSLTMFVMILIFLAWPYIQDGIQKAWRQIRAA